MLSLANDRELYGTHLCSFEWFRDLCQLGLLLLVGSVFRDGLELVLEATSLVGVAVLESVAGCVASRRELCVSAACVSIVSWTPFELSEVSGVS